ncbi:YggS family pyridoxal phosphate-dependent enzyme [Corynebacterium sp. H127]|uniref:YggS family pyridoxal phosphate-dependent enzyme n=1 Tax=Corynebacterium sp. H127 TaxID=3133418 RepID=UPI00309CAB41
MSRAAELAANLAAVRERIAIAEAAVGRTSGEVQLLPVTKFHPASDLAELIRLGVSDVAENREQEAREKAASCPAARIHMVGQIQTKKANSVARWAACVHSVDSLKLVQALDRAMGLAIERGDRQSEPLPCFIQLSLDGDVTRGGIEVEGVEKLAAAMEESSHLRLSGVMCVPPKGWDPAEAFLQAAAVRSRLEGAFGRSMEFSAGMSGDLETAISCGSTIVRVGTAILGTRQLR